MNQADRDRLVALKKAKKKLITQKQAAEEIGVTERQVRRLLRKLRRKGDRAVIHELRGQASNRKLPAEMEQRAITILSDPVYRGFGPTLAAEYLHQRHQITVSKETLRRWMAKAGLWRAGRRRVVEVHLEASRCCVCADTRNASTLTALPRATAGRQARRAAVRRGRASSRSAISRFRRSPGRRRARGRTR